ncbi:cytochrome c oxidase assembly protein [Blastococcus sp. MG754426]|uniref:Cytochrome c oxidase assembly protein n=2 Tax=Geodermatophilaceae TaxID=85030 RepID=A0ABU8E5X3_9ACTN|nr:MULTISPECIES: cytochrome c oxidase assembly protein [Geodermatophilaceae]MCF6510053.1 cytochrome c oxidase assembly protein [Blastococcus sp. MG754426]MCF6514430.1 cytochrome c oxidase assembly protein [Blastococcus sp. MG754427]SOC53007.1 putative membrane protein [Blastococcus aggregatus]SSC22156.1 Cytochrome c oxidase caa3-type, assembly factor CtaG-related [Klenkia terrae]
MSGAAVLAHGGSHGTGSAAAAWLLPVLVAVVLGAGYLAGVARMRGSGRRWSGGRTASFLLGAVLVGAALSPAVDAGTADGHMAQHLLLGMFAPIALVMGAPVTLLLSGLPVSARRPAAVLLRSRVLHGLSHVATAAVLSVGGLYLLYLTPLYALSARSDVVHHLLHLHFLLAGYLFAWAVAGPDPAPRRPGMAVRLVVLVVAGGLHAFLAKLLFSRAPVLPVGGGHDAAEVEVAAQLMYYGGHVADLLLLVALFAAWYRRTGRALAREPAAVASNAPAV